MSKEKSLIALAQRFHNEYERLAPSFGYETRPETRVFDPESPNGKLMLAVCSALALPDSEPAIAPTAGGPGWHKFPAHLQNPDGRSLMTASYLLGRQGYIALTEILKGMAEDLLEKAPTLPSGAAIAPALALPSNNLGDPLLLL